MGSTVLDCGSPESMMVTLVPAWGSDRFYIKNLGGDYLDANSAHGNTVKWWPSPDRSPGRSPSNLQWQLKFAAWEGHTYFYIVSVARNMYLDSHGSYADLWVSPKGLGDVGRSPSNIMWMLKSSYS